MADLLQIQENVPLAPYTTLGVGGRARWFATAVDEVAVQAACAFAAERGLALFVMGGGSNLLISDAGFGGLVLRIAINGIAYRQEDNGRTFVTAGAGESWDALVQSTVDRNLGGMECLAGIPGSVGGTPVQNVGAYGQEVAQTLVSARGFDRRTRSMVHLPHAQFGFGYRTSLLNTSERGRYILTSVTFALQPGAPPDLSYADLKRHFTENAQPALADVADAVRHIRRKKGMVVDLADPDSRSAGSFFRNPVVSQDKLQAIAASLQMLPEQVPHWPTVNGCAKLPAAWLLEQAGFARGFTLGQAGISSKHTLALINRGSATAEEIATLRDRIALGVHTRFGVDLEQEPVSVG